ncbi:MAG TPA: hypothetical protein VE569_12090 [Acidimicrobiia bacterium]|nr:hypothetical protein [Acidimicrobiia bacterium]
MARHNKRLPAWLLGLIIAAVVFVLAIFIFGALGYGDEPVIEGLVTVVG